MNASMQLHRYLSLLLLLSVCLTTHAVTDQFLPPLNTVRSIHYPLFFIRNRPGMQPGAPGMPGGAPGMPGAAGMSGGQGMQRPGMQRPGMQRGQAGPTQGMQGPQSTMAQIKDRFDVDTRQGFTIRTGGNAFFDECPDKVTRHLEPLVALFFGKPDFFVEESFPDGMINPTEPGGVVGFPAVSLARIKPLFEFSDIGVFFSGRFLTRVGAHDNWFVGGRTLLMVRSVGGIRPAVVQFPLGDVIAHRQEDLPTGAGTNSVNANAYRLDYVSLLANPVSKAPILSYGDGTATTMTIGGADISGHVDVKRAQSGVALAVQPLFAQAASGTPLNAEGTNGAEGARLGFIGATNYKANLGQDRSAQQKLFLVPDSSGALLDPIALAAQNGIDGVVDFIDQTGFESATQYLRTQGVSFEEDEFSKYGLTDWEFIFLGGYNPDNWYIELGAGFRLPSGRTVHCPGELLVQPVDTNGHVTWLGGFEIGCSPRRWVGLRASAYGAHVCNHTEKRAAPFKGATIKNIGPTVDLNVSWNYFVGSIDMTILHPTRANVGITGGYEYFIRGLSNVTTKKKTARDFRGLVKELDVEVIRARTNTVVHQLRGEVFFNMGLGEIFVGVSRAVAGRNALRSTQANIGLNITY